MTKEAIFDPRTSTRNIVNRYDENHQFVPKMGEKKKKTIIGIVKCHALK